jgi:multicomponent Na+:H+ antiporter subunit D
MSELTLVGLFAGLALAVALYALSLPQGGASWWGLAALSVALVLAGRAAGPSWGGAICLDVAELAAVALVWTQGTGDTLRAARRYLGAIAPAIVCTIAGQALVGHAAAAPAPPVDKFAVCLLLVGFALKLGLIPFCFWLPAVAAAAPTMTTALIVSIVDIATVAELLDLRQIAPWVFTEHAAIWMVIALLSLCGGALLALAQRELKRMLAFSTIADLGLLLTGVVAGGSLGLAGAQLGAVSHAVSKVILFGTVGLAEQRITQPLTLDTRGLAARLPLASAAFVIGALGFIGVPPGLGFVGYWRLYVSGTEYGGPALLGVLFLVAALDLLCYVRAIHRVWLGPAQVGVSGAPASLAQATVTVLALGIILLGLYPGVLTTAAGFAIAVVK